MFNWDEKNHRQSKLTMIFHVEALYATSLLCKDLSLFQTKFAVSQINVSVGLNPSVARSWLYALLNGNV